MAKINIDGEYNRFLISIYIFVKRAYRQSLPNDLCIVDRQLLIFYYYLLLISPRKNIAWEKRDLHD